MISWETPKDRSLINLTSSCKISCNFLIFQKSLFIFNLYRNPRVPCPSIPDIDFSHWREEATQCRVNGVEISLGLSRKISPCTSCTCTKEGVSSISRKLVQLMFWIIPLLLSGSMSIVKDQQLSTIDIWIWCRSCESGQHLQDPMLVRVELSRELGYAPSSFTVIPTFCAQPYTTSTECGASYRKQGQQHSQPHFASSHQTHEQSSRVWWPFPTCTAAFPADSSHSTICLARGPSTAAAQASPRAAI